jgi:6-phosphogluconolactonase/glucosamine-6-phosphate isomerase/deaminase
MNIQVFNTDTALAEYSAGILAKALRDKPESLCCFAAGFTQNDTYACFAQLVRQEEIPTDRMRVIGLDEWGGLNGRDRGSCRAYIDERIIGPLGLRADQLLFFFDGRVPFGPQCEQADRILDREGPIDILVLGAGMNGHVGFNEPGDTDSLRSHFLQLSATSVTVGQKYFNEQKALSTGATLGLSDLLKAKQTILQITGAHKAPVVKALRDGEAPECLPAAYIAQGSALVFADRAAYGT